MGLWDLPLFINGDSTLEVAMEMLCVVGLGPKDYAARRGEKAVMMYRLLPDGAWRYLGESHGDAVDPKALAAMHALKEKYGDDPSKYSVMVGRHTPAEYDEFFACWRAATGRHKLIEKKFSELMSFCAPYATIRDHCSGDRPNCGSSFHLFFLLLMQNGCALPPNFKESVMLHSLAYDELSKIPSEYARRVFVRKVRDLVVDYDERGGSAVEYVIESFAEVAPNMYSGDPESQKARALYIAENFDARVKRSSFSRGPPPSNYKTFGFHTIRAKQREIREMSRRVVGDAPAARSEVHPGDVEPRDYDPTGNHPGKVARDAKRSIKASANLDPEQCCGFCGKWNYGADANVTLRRCAKCLTIYYCSAECQRKHWPHHKKGCRQMKANREAARAGDRAS